jgi:erythrocyte band 7 integral membrane protein
MDGPASFKPLCVSCVAADESDGDGGVCGTILTALSWILIICTLPFSLCVCFKV